MDFLKNRTIKSIASNTFFQLISKVITMTITFTLTIIISREYGSYGYGLFTLFQSFPVLFYMIADFGLNAIGTREISKNLKEINKIFNNVLFLRIFLSLFLVLVSIVATLYLYDDVNVRYGLILGALIIVSQTLVSTTNIIFQIKLRYDLSSVSNVISYIFLLVSVLLLVSNKVDVAILNFIYVLASFIAFGINIYLLKRFDVRVDLNISREYIKELVLMSWPLGLMFIFSQINFKADSIMLSLLKLPDLGLNNIQSVGVYGLPYKIFEVLLVVPTFIMNSTYPALLDSYNLNIKKFKDNIIKTVAVMSVVGGLVSLLGYLFINHFLTFEIIESIFGPEFTYSKQLLLILFSGIFVFFITQPLSWFMVIRDKQKILPLIYAISAIFNVSMNYYLIPKYSFIASAYLTWISEGIILILLVIFTFKYWPRNVR
jgi:O-antigen/teichoic acid export membrane protein